MIVVSGPLLFSAHTLQSTSHSLVGNVLDFLRAKRVLPSLYSPTTPLQSDDAFDRIFDRQKKVCSDKFSKEVTNVGSK